MAYDVLSDDLYDDGEVKSSKKKKAPKKKFEFKPIYLHILIIIVVVILFFYLFSKGLSVLNFGDEEEGVFTFIGEVDNFSEVYSGDIELFSSRFILTRDQSILEDTSKDIEIDDFNGRIYQDNKSIILEGTASNIRYGKNKIKLGDDRFTLESLKKTNIDLEFDILRLDVVKGTAKLDDSFKHDFVNGTVSLSKFNVSLAYDGTFSFSGKPDSFTVSSPDQNLEINYVLPKELIE